MAQPVHEEAGKKAAEQEGATKGVIVNAVPPWQRAKDIDADIETPAHQLQRPEAEIAQVGIRVSYFRRYRRRRDLCRHHHWSGCCNYAVTADLDGVGKVDLVIPYASDTVCGSGDGDPSGYFV